MIRFFNTNIQFRKFILSLSILCLIGTTSIPALGKPNTATDQKKKKDYEAARQELVNLFKRVEELRDWVNDADFDPVTLAQEIGPDYLALYEFVRDYIAYEPYPGVLRMADGTLMSRAGNAYDQSLLLASMLESNGYPVRFARAQLSSVTAKRVLAQIKPSDQVDRPMPFAQVTHPAIRAIFEHLGMSVEDARVMTKLSRAQIVNLLGEVFHGLDLDYALVKNVLRNNGINPETGENPMSRRAIASVSDHCWVQVQWRGQWIDLDPVMATFKPGERLAAPGSVTSHLPDDLLYRLHYRLTVESTVEGKPESHSVLDKEFLLDRSINRIQLSLAPEIEQKNVDDFQHTAKQLDTFNVVWPLLSINNKKQKGKPFDLSGKLVDPDPKKRTTLTTTASSPVGGGFGGFGDIIQGKVADQITGQATKQGKLQRIVLTIRSISPDGMVRKGNRVLFTRPDDDVLGENKGQEAIRRLLPGHHEYISTASRVSIPLLNAKQIEYLLLQKETFQALLDNTYGKQTMTASQFLERGMEAYPFRLLVLLSFRHAFLDLIGAWNFPELSAYTAEPQLVSESIGADRLRPLEKRIEKRIDIVFNSVTALSASGAPQDAGSTRRLALRQGLIDTNLERMLVKGRSIGNTHIFFQKFLKAGETVDLIKNADSSLLDSRELDTETKKAILRDLSAGYLVIIPRLEEMPGGLTGFAWWRINPMTGQVLGMSGYGEGQAFIETPIMHPKTIVYGMGFGGLFNGLMYYLINVELLGEEFDAEKLGERVYNGVVLGGLFAIPGALLFNGIYVYVGGASSGMLGLVTAGAASGMVMGPIDTIGDALMSGRPITEEEILWSVLGGGVFGGAIARVSPLLSRVKSALFGGNPHTTKPPKTSTPSDEQAGLNAIDDSFRTMDKEFGVETYRTRPAPPLSKQIPTDPGPRPGPGPDLMDEVNRGLTTPTRNARRLSRKKLYEEYLNEPYVPRDRPQTRHDTERLSRSDMPHVVEDGRKTRPYDRQGTGGSGSKDQGPSVPSKSSPVQKVPKPPKVEEFGPGDLPPKTVGPLKDIHGRELPKQLKEMPDSFKPIFEQGKIPFGKDEKHQNWVGMFDETANGGKGAIVDGPYVIGSKGHADMSTGPSGMGKGFTTGLDPKTGQPGVAGSQGRPGLSDKAKRMILDDFIVDMTKK